MENWWNSTRENQSTRRKACLGSTLSASNLTRSGLVLKSEYTNVFISYLTDNTMCFIRGFRLPPRFWWDLRFYGILRSVEWWSFTDVSGQRVGPIFKGQEVQGEKNTPEERRSQQCVFSLETTIRTLLYREIIVGYLKNNMLCAENAEFLFLCSIWRFIYVPPYLKWFFFFKMWRPAFLW